MNLKSVLPFYSLDPFIVSENSTYYLSTNWGSLRSDCTGTGGDGLVYARIVILAGVLVLAFIPRVNILVKSGPSTDTTWPCAGLCWLRSRVRSEQVRLGIIASSLGRGDRYFALVVHGDTMLAKSALCTGHGLLMFLLSLVAFLAVADDQLWGRLQHDPNMIVLMRNSESDGNRDGANMLEWDASGNCAGESTLTGEGKAHAKRIGAAFAMHGIEPVVISSPMCRCSETARIAFGDFVTDPDLRQSAGGDARGQEQFLARAKALLGEHRGKIPIVFVNHRPNIDLLTMELLNIGDLLVGSVSETGEIEVLGTIRVELPGANVTGTGKAK